MDGRLRQKKGEEGRVRLWVLARKFPAEIQDRVALDHTPQFISIHFLMLHQEV